MSGQLAGFPFWALEFNEDGVLAGGAGTVLQEIPAAQLTDLFIFSHGWNNDHNTAMNLYTGFFGEVRKLIDDDVRNKAGTSIGVAGILWPSISFLGTPLPWVALAEPRVSPAIRTRPRWQANYRRFSASRSNSLCSRTCWAFCRRSRRISRPC